jgi:ABC-2 type transport system permease protein
MRILKLYMKFIPIYFKSKTEYGFGFYADFIGFMITHAVNYLLIWVMLDRFKTINGWDFYEMLFLYTMNLFTYGIAAIFFFFQMRDMEEMIHQGTFDGILTKPINPFIHMIIRTFGHFFLGDVFVGLIMFIICFHGMHLSITLLSGFYFVLTILGAVLIQASFIILTGAMSFWFVRSRAITNMVVYYMRGFVNYPISIYGKLIHILLTFIVPYAFVNFYPVQMFLGKADEGIFHPVILITTPLVGIVLFTLSYFVWKSGINRYQGTGS